MRKLYNAFFYVSDEEKISEKVILTRMVTTVVIIVSCLLAMGITAYAYFSCGVASGANTIKAANFQAQIDITTDGQSGLVNPTAIQGALRIYSFQPGTYKVELKIGDSTASTGFCIVRIDQTEYHTQQIGVDVSAVNQRRDCIAFMLNVEQPATVSIQSHWGTSSYYDYISTDENPLYIKDAEPLQVIVVNDAVSSSNESEEEVQDENREETDETGDVPEQTVYIAKEGESLALIAELYGTTVERLAAYNEILDPRVIQIGQPIQIPPEDWQLPENDDQYSPPLLPTESDDEKEAEATDLTDATDAIDAADATGQAVSAEQPEV